MKLQIAYDVGTYQDLVILINKIQDLIDIIEIGTPLILREGLGKISYIKKKFPDKKIIADMKIMDAGEIEADIGFDSGADIVSVLGLASMNTLLGVKTSANKKNKQVMVDMINHPDPVMHWMEILKYGLDYICLHNAHDDINNTKNMMNIIQQFSKKDKCENLALAGGIEPVMLKKIKKYQPGIVIVGSYITMSENPREATENIRKILN